MNTVLVTGGSGVLGRTLLPFLRHSGAAVRVVSRRADALPGVYRGDLQTGEGLREALDGVQTIVHAASQPGRPAADLEMTRTLLGAARAAGVNHLVYVSIVGCDRVRALPYYRAKTQAEALVAAGGLPYSVVRATQFHEFVAFVLSRVDRWPVLALPTLPLQPVEVVAAAQQVARVALGSPLGRAPDVVGPDVLTLPELAGTWRAATGQRGRVLTLPVGRSFTALTRPDVVGQGRSWQSWLAQAAHSPNPYAS